jgi:DNA topoisomerase-1
MLRTGDHTQLILDKPSVLKDNVLLTQDTELVYVTDEMPGIKRLKKGKGFIYTYKNKQIRNEKELKRIKKLVLPPAWKNVWICLLDNGHLQATGYDVKKRKQYKYHAQWSEHRNRTKYASMLDFGKVLPKIRMQLKKDLSLSGLPQRKVLALVVTLMEHTNIRIGNESYEKLYGSYGLTTLKDKHVSFKKSDVCFSFKGKKGVKHCIHLHHKRLATLVKRCKDIPGKELFQYFDEEGHHKPIDSGMVNEYIKEISGSTFSAKDFRTWWGTMNALMALKEAELVETTKGKKKIVVEALDCVAKQLGNTRSVCKKYYVHPLVIDLFERDQLKKYFKHTHGSTQDISATEKALVKILKKAS